MNFLDHLRKDGIAYLPRMDVTLVVAHLSARPQHPGHVKVYPHEENTSCYEMRDVLSAPGFLRYATALTGGVADYLGVETPWLYSVNAFWTRPSGPDLHGLMTFHTDQDDSNFVAMFVYGTDVLCDDDGAHLFTKRNGEIEKVLGPAGTVFIEDPRCRHMGLRPKTKPRLLLWARWGVSRPPASYLWDQLEPVDRREVADYPNTTWKQRSIELVAR